MGYWYFRYPFKTMGISQNYNGSYSHKKYSTGNRKDYPIDEAGSDTGRDYMYAMNDLVVKKIYGLGSSSRPNTIWLQTKRKVVTPLGIGYVTFRATHMSDADLKKYKVGQTIKRGTKMFREGTDGGATGNHIHMTFGQGKYKSPGWKPNNKGAYVLTTTGRNRKPEKILFRDTTFTKKVRMTAGLKFKTKPKRKNKTTKKKVNVRKSYSAKSARVGTLPKGKKVTVYVTRGKYSCIGSNMWVMTKYLK